MLTEFIKSFDASREQLHKQFSLKHPEDYAEIVKSVVQVLHDNCSGYDKPDPERITEINHGSYQGTLIYVIGSTGYQPDDYWYVRVYYGSCSGCDTFERIRGWDDVPTKQQADDYLTLALHIVQNMRKMEDCGA